MWISFDRTADVAFPGKFAMATITTDHTAIFRSPMATVITDSTSILPISMGAGPAYAAVIFASNPTMWAWTTWPYYAWV